MSFLVILLVLLVEKFSDWRPRLQYDSPWLTRLRQVEASPRLRQTPWLALLLLVLFRCCCSAWCCWHWSRWPTGG